MFHKSLDSVIDVFVVFSSLIFSSLYVRLFHPSFTLIILSYTSSFVSPGHHPSTLSYFQPFRFPESFIYYFSFALTPHVCQTPCPFHFILSCNATNFTLSLSSSLLSLFLCIVFSPLSLLLCSLSASKCLRKLSQVSSSF